ncbi:carbon-nitrogen hydrolase [Hyaloraphidium curvatum]|nr:carbon-nitrogen hydrolase [Hyaloraphidium curvatum]
MTLRGANLRRTLRRACRPEPGLLLAPLLGLFAFFQGWQPLQPLSFAWAPLFVLMALHGNALTFAAAWAASVLGCWGSLTGSFGWIADEEGPYFDSGGLTLSFLLGMLAASGMAIVVLLNMLVVRGTERWASALWFRILFYPQAATGMYAILAAYSPLGQAGSPAETAFASRDLVVGSLYLGGVSLANLAVLGAASLAAYVVEKAWFDLVEETTSDGVEQSIAVEADAKQVDLADAGVIVAVADSVERDLPQPEASAEVQTPLKTRWGSESFRRATTKLAAFVTHPISVPLTILLVVVTTGAVFNMELPLVFYQKQAFSAHSTDTFSFGCMAIQSRTDEFFLSEAAKMAARGTRFITTSELGLGASVSAANETAWLAKFQDFARNATAYLGIGYLVAIDPEDPEANYNRFTTIAPDGRVLAKYDKNRPVPLSEDTFVVAGASPPPVIELDPRVLNPSSNLSRPLRVLVATCFDGEFPSLLRPPALAAGGADLFLHPTWLWGSPSTLIDRVYPYRAVDLGLTELRCASGGTSGAYGPLGTAAAAYRTHRDTVLDFEVPLVPGAGSVYLHTGDVVGWACLGVAGALLIYVGVGRWAPFGRGLAEFRVWGRVRRYRTAEAAGARMEEERVADVLAMGCT